MAAHRLPGSEFRLLGALPLGFFVAQAVHYWQINQLGHMLWMCNIGNLLLAVGLFLGEAILIRVAVIWMIPGLLVWFVYVVPTWGMVLTGKGNASELYGVVSSTLAHVGGISVGWLALRRVRMDGRAWLYAFMWYFVVQQISRLLTPIDMNVNLSQRIREGWQQTFSSYFKFWLVLSLMVGVSLWLLAFCITKIMPNPDDSYAAKG